MPQIEQLPIVFISQLFWLAIVFGIIFFGIGRGMLPKIQSTVELREKKIAEDLEQAQAARAAAEETEARWRARMDEARSEAARLSQQARQDSAQKSEAKVRAAADKIGLKAAAADKRLREAVEAARAEIEAVAAEATQEMVARLTGISVDRKDAVQAVKAEFHA
jgi:F-type H+-transporting ATPase subunit b